MQERCGEMKAGSPCHFVPHCYKWLARIKTYKVTQGVRIALVATPTRSRNLLRGVRGRIREEFRKKLRNPKVCTPHLEEAWKAVGKRLLDIARDGDAEACGHLTTWGTTMAAIKESHVNVDHYAASEADSPEPSVPPEPGLVVLCVQFLARLQAMLSRQVDNDEARSIPLQQLAFTNMNEDCRKALLAVCNLHICDIADMDVPLPLARETVWTVNDMSSCLVKKGRKRLQTLNGQDPHTIYIPASKDNLASLLSEDTNFYIALADFSGQLSIHYPSHHLWTVMGNLPLYAECHCSMTPVNRPTVFTDTSSSTNKAVIWHEPLDIITDFSYAANVVFCLESSYLKHATNHFLFTDLRTLQQHDFYVCSHTGLPRPITEGNNYAAITAMTGAKTCTEKQTYFVVCKGILQKIVM
ncbi:hypothetical protein IHE44_0005119 [Lamprotornis superbus]|uniref:Uncharacterized protein n=1 Tax=Lamprotornis superbus TaxID=245042 RepID=A0A835NMH8_9PASS|nr:hypothetical protein IHE44_0005119 [Lamprotornis superbus]